MTGISRRTVIGSGAAAVGALAANQMLPSAASASSAGPRPAPAPAPAGGAYGKGSGSIEDIKHVVILMQENRSFDHYYGSLGGVRGFADKQALTYPNGTSILAQPDTARSTKTLLPFRMDTSKFDAQDADDLDHTWAGTHSASNGGAWNKWVSAKGEQAMGYFTRADLPFQYALADAYTICDAYHCSIQGPTIPNRLFHWTGTNDPSGAAGGPATTNPAAYAAVYNWTTYPERLQQAGITWQVYANNESGDANWLGDYGDNPLWHFQAYQDAQASTDPDVQDLAKRGAVMPFQPNTNQGHAVDHVLAQFIADCNAGTLPTVSWIVAPYLYSEHPKSRPVDGAAYTAGVLQAVWSNPTLWASTVILLNYDENDGYFDHVTPPFAAPGTPDEFIAGLPVGLGPRVPMTIVSPWTHGGWVNSQIFDHTSVIRFLEQVTGVQEPNISAWRRSICGDLTSCFDFGTVNPTPPVLPNVTALATAANAELSLPAVKAPTGTQSAPTQESTVRKHRPLPYQPGGNVSVNRSTGVVTATMTNTGSSALALNVFANNVTPFVATPLIAASGKNGVYTFNAKSTSSHYDFAVHGPNGFVRSFAGTVVATGAKAAFPTVTTALSGTIFKITLGNSGTTTVKFTLTSGAYISRSETHSVAAGKTASVSWPTSDGFYDVTVAAASPSGFKYRYAGRIEA